MSRPQRIEYRDAYYHVMNSGQNGKAIFSNMSCIQAFLETLDEAHQRFGIEVHAYCLLKQNYHLLLKTPEGNLQRAMRQIGGVYTQRYNQIKKCEGPVFKGRYKSVLLDPKRYLLDLSRFIHRLPLEQGKAQSLDEHAASSYLAYVGTEQAPSWLFQQEVYAQLKPKPQTAKEYQRFCNQTEGSEVLQSFYQKKRISPILGEESFINSLIKILSDSNEAAHIRANRPTLDQIVVRVSDYYGLDKRDIYRMKKGRGVKNQPRKLAMYLCQNLGSYSLSEIADKFGLSHYGGVSNAIYMVKQELSDNVDLKKAFDSLSY